MIRAFRRADGLLIFQPRLSFNKTVEVWEGLESEGDGFGSLASTLGQKVYWWIYLQKVSVGIIQYFQKRSSKIEMSFIFYINNGFATVAAVEQFPSYYQNLGSYYSATDQLYLPSSYPQSVLQIDQNPSCDPVGILPTEVPHDEPQQALPLPERPPLKQKRRMEKTIEKEILSAKKNSESNIINQFYSFFSSKEKSERIVQRCANLLGKSSSQVEKILSIFYTTIRFINAKRGRKYVNVNMFMKFFTEDEFGEYLSQMKEKVERLDFLTLAELCEIFRRCAKYYLREVSTSAILTSKRISIVSKEQHLKKRRKVLRSVMGT